MGVREFCKGDVDTWPRHHYCLRIPDKIPIKIFLVFREYFRTYPSQNIPLALKPGSMRRKMT